MGAEGKKQNKKKREGEYVSGTLAYNHRTKKKQKCEHAKIYLLILGDAAAWKELLRCLFSIGGVSVKSMRLP